MNMAAIDWVILGSVYLILVASVLLTKRYMRSVTDFLAAGRTAGRYLISVGQGMAALGAITIVAYLEMGFEAGFSMSWWGLSTTLVTTLIAVSGWVIYRFRATRCLTLAEFFERRYSRRFRIFAGGLAFFAGLINFGIFPAVGARFFIYFMGLPPELSLLGVTVGTYPLIMIVLLATALYFVYAGGHVAVIITDFVQGIFCNIVFVILSVYLMYKVPWTQVAEVLVEQPPGESLVNPFDTGHIETFNFWYFLIGIVGVLYVALSWQGTQAYNTSAKSAHEAKMGMVLGQWRGIPQGLLMLFVPVVAFAVMRHPEWAGLQAQVNGALAGVEDNVVRSQLRVPLVLANLLPVGLVGAFSAVMLAAFISTNNTYLHSWGSIFIQDVVMPFRREPFSPRQHLRVLRWSMLGVAGFIFVFSLFYRQTEYILLFFAITAAIFAGGSGAVIIGGLYWKRGTTAAAWTALLTGSTIAVGGLVIRERYPEFPVNGQEFWGIAMGASTLLYILVSLLGKPRVHNLDRLLHRGRYALREELKIEDAAPSRGWRIFGMGREFSRRDKVLYIATYLWTFLWTATFIAGTIYCLTHRAGNGPWLKYWGIYIWIQIVMSVVVIVWLGIGGYRDVRSMMRQLAVMQRDDADDGMVREAEP